MRIRKIMRIKIRIILILIILKSPNSLKKLLMIKMVSKFRKQRIMHSNMMKLRTYLMITLPMITLRVKMMRNFEERKHGIDFKIMRIKIMRIMLILIIFLILINLMRINSNNANSHYFTNNCLIPVNGPVKG